MRHAGNCGCSTHAWDTSRAARPRAAFLTLYKLQLGAVLRTCIKGRPSDSCSVCEHHALLSHLWQGATSTRMVGTYGGKPGRELHRAQRLGIGSSCGCTQPSQCRGRSSAARLPAPLCAHLGLPLLAPSPVPSSDMSSTASDSQALRLLLRVTGRQTHCQHPCPTRAYPGTWHIPGLVRSGSCRGQQGTADQHQCTAEQQPRQSPAAAHRGFRGCAPDPAGGAGQAVPSQPDRQPAQRLHLPGELPG